MVNLLLERSRMGDIKKGDGGLKKRNAPDRKGAPQGVRPEWSDEVGPCRTM